MKVLLIDLDSLIPNLALQKLSAYWKQRGATVILRRGVRTSAACANPDKVYISCIFTRSKRRLEAVMERWPNAEVGGVGADYLLMRIPHTPSVLPPEIENGMPDYDLYGEDVAQGFTHWGCIRKCGFCAVPKIQGAQVEHHDFEAFVPEGFRKVRLLDNNFLASPTHIEKLRWLIDHDMEVNFCQGLDIRLVTPENAALLAQVKFRSRSMRSKVLTFAFDTVGIEKSVRRGCTLLKEAGVDLRHRVQFFVLVGFESTLEQDLYRIRVLRELGTNPFIMLYEGASLARRRLARWCNRKEIFYAVPEPMDYAPFAEALVQERDQQKLEAFG